MKTVVYIAHPDVASSTSHQFLISSGQANSSCEYVDLTSVYNENQQTFDVQAERQRLLECDRIIFQFQLHWYQAPAIMKIWLDAVLEETNESNSFYGQLKGKELGVAVIAGVKAEHYQSGGREQRTISELLSPYETLARHFGMHYLAPFAVHQFNYMDEQMKFDLMMRYGCFLETGDAYSFTKFQAYILRQLNALTPSELALTETDQVLFDMFVTEIEDQASDLGELVNLMDSWD